MLSKRNILDAALRVADRDGLGKLTQRRLAQELGVSPMATYRHFRDKDAILSALLDHVIDPPALLGACAGPDLEEGLVALFRGIREIFVAHPALAPLAGTTGSLGDNALQVLERVLFWLREEGVENQDALRLLHVLVSYALGASLIAAAATTAVPDARKRLASLDLDDYPSVVGAAPELLRFPAEEPFDEHLRRLVKELLPPSLQLGADESTT
ncbi:MAG: TetR/AcrR family transcriptional regulator [Myxococcota bacterium]